MRILVIIHEFPPIGGGGGRAAYDICTTLAHRGHEVIVLTAHIQGLPYEETQNGIRIIRVRSFRTERFRATFGVMLAYVLAGLWAGLSLIKRHRPDIIHAHFAVPAGSLAWLFSIFTGIPYILTAHLGDVPGGVPEKTHTWFRWLLPFTYPIWNRAKKVIAVSQFTRQLALVNYKVPIDVIPNGADVSHLSPLEIKINQPPRLVFAGRFVVQKNTLTIIQILSQLKDLDWRCAMLGDGPLFEEVKREIEQNGMQDRFELSGWITPDDVLEWFSESDILFMPSLSEGLPVVGVQALAKGLALVVSDIGGFKDLVDEGINGHLIEYNDISGFESKLRLLLIDPEKLYKFRLQSLQKALRFDNEDIGKNYEDIFGSLVGEKQKF
jgi:glycosyltransferase involved in cell wall biosynthesis